MSVLLAFTLFIILPSYNGPSLTFKPKEAQIMMIVKPKTSFQGERLNLRLDFQLKVYVFWLRFVAVFSKNLSNYN
jgi:hypothetical protein